jgi:replicative DNA helicase
MMSGLRAGQLISVHVIPTLGKYKTGLKLLSKISLYLSASMFPSTLQTVIDNFAYKMLFT